MLRLSFSFTLLSLYVLGQEPHFLTLPFRDDGVKIQQGWHYQDGELHFPRGAIDYVKGTLDDSSTWQSFDVLAAAGGAAIWDDDPAGDRSNYGNMVIIRHDALDGSGKHYFTIYAHLAPGTIPAKIPKLGRRNVNFEDWERVEAGEFIGKAGQTGYTRCVTNNCTHLHFEVNAGGYFQQQTDAYRVFNKRAHYPGSCLAYLWKVCPPSVTDVPSPNTAPTARFTITSGTHSVIEGQTMQLNVPTGSNANIGISMSRSSDPDGTVAGGEITIDGKPFFSFIGTPTVAASLGIGTHTISVVVRDNSGIQSPPATATVIVAVSTPPTNAITFNFTGAVTAIQDANLVLGGSVPIGTTLSGSLTYELGKVDTDPSPQTGAFQYVTGSSRIVVTLNTPSGPRIVSSAFFGGNGFGVFTVNDAVIGDVVLHDEVVIQGWAPPANSQLPLPSPAANSLISIKLSDRLVPLTLLASDTLPTSLDLSRTQAPFNDQTYISASSGTAGYYIHFSLTNLTKQVLLPPSYTIEELGVLPGGSAGSSGAYTLSNGGTVAGLSDGPNDAEYTGCPSSNGLTGKPVIWTTEGVRLLSAPAVDVNGTARKPCDGTAWAMNDGGMVVGHLGYGIGLAGSGVSAPFVWTAQSGMQVLLNGSGGATSINNAGTVVGSAGGSAFRWTPSGGFQPLGIPAQNSAATDVNEWGEIVGYSQIEACNRGPVLWNSSGQPQSLNLQGLTSALPPHQYLCRNGASAINDNGVIVGSVHVVFSTGTGRLFGWLYSNGATQVLGELSASAGSGTEPHSINNDGFVVGESNGRAFRWTPTSGMQDLNSLLDVSGTGWTLLRAHAINEVGQIVGLGLRNGSPRAFRLTPKAHP